MTKFINRCDVLFYCGDCLFLWIDNAPHHTPQLLFVSIFLSVLCLLLFRVQFLIMPFCICFGMHVFVFVLRFDAVVILLFFIFFIFRVSNFAKRMLSFLFIYFFISFYFVLCQTHQLCCSLCFLWVEVLSSTTTTWWILFSGVSSLVVTA